MSLLRISNLLIWCECTGRVPFSHLDTAVLPPQNSSMHPSMDHLQEHCMHWALKPRSSFLQNIGLFQNLRLDYIIDLLKYAWQRDSNIKHVMASPCSHKDGSQNQGGFAHIESLGVYCLGAHFRKYGTPPLEKYRKIYDSGIIFYACKDMIHLSW